MSKCAEHGISPYEAGSLFMQKQAFFPIALPVLAALGGASYLRRGAHNDAYRQYNRQINSFAEGISDPRARADFMRQVRYQDAGAPGTLVGRAFRRLYMGRDSADQYYRNLANSRIEEAMNRQTDAMYRNKDLEAQRASLMKLYSPQQGTPSTGTAPATGTGTAPAAGTSTAGATQTGQPAPQAQSAKRMVSFVR